MQPHPYFALQLHDDTELSALLGSPLRKRTTLHEWPLSCVQRLRCLDGRSVIYKVQAPPTVEPTFYRQAQSGLLVAAQVLTADDQGIAALLLEDVQAPTLHTLAADAYLPQQPPLLIVEEILAGIAQIEGELPALADIRGEAQWLTYVQAICADLHVLVADGTFQRVSHAMIQQLAMCGASSAVRAAINGPTGYVHLDLRGENVLVVADSYRVLDWQRPIWGPVALDRATLLETVGMDPAAHVAKGVLQLRKLLQIGWLAQAARHWFPPGAPTYDQQIAKLAEQIGHIGL